MKKSWAAYWTADILAAAAAALLFSFGLFIRTAGIIAAVFLLWWTAYFFQLNYSTDNDEISIQSGIVFRKKIHIPRVNILWTTRVSFCVGNRLRIPLFTLIRTAGGKTVIFCDYLTDS